MGYILPFTYTFLTRMKENKSTVFFHCYYEWIVSVGILYLVEGYSLSDSICYFLLAYFSFISIYEIGYLVNDFYSIRYERNPRPRLKKVNWSGAYLYIFVAIRILFFFLISSFLDLLTTKIWIYFYFILCVVFMMHNLLRNEELKPITFSCLAFLRFFAPVFPFISLDTFNSIFPPFFICYLLYRLINYLDSKDFLMMPNRRTPKWKLSFYLITFILNTFISLLLWNIVPVALNAYYLIFWAVYFITSKNRWGILAS